MCAPVDFSYYCYRSCVCVVLCVVLCGVVQAATQMMNSALCFPLRDPPPPNGKGTVDPTSLPSCVPEHFATVASGVVDNYYSCHWHAKETKLFSLANTSVSVEGLTNEATCLRNMMAFPCSPWEDTLLESKLKAKLPAAYYSLVDQTLSHKYARHAAASSPPTFSWEMGFTKVFFIQPSCVAVPTTLSGGQVHASFLPRIVDSYTQNVLSNTCNHLILLLRSPEDLMKHSSLWGEEDAQVEVQTPLPEEKSTENKTVRRGKHEILYGAHSDAPDTTAQKMFAKTSALSQQEVRKGGDVLFNSVIRALHRWLTGAPVGARRVTLVSCRWTAGMDFSLCLDGDMANFISHVSLEPTGMNPQCTSILNRIKYSFQDTVTLETGPLNSTSRMVVFDVVCSDGSPGACKFEAVSSPKARITKTIPFLKQELILHGSPKIVYLSSDEVCVELSSSGYGYVTCSLYEVPCMVGYADAHRIIETELSSLYVLQKISNRFIGNYVESKFTFRDLAAFCAYCIIISTSEDDPTKRTDSAEPPLPEGSLLSTPPFVHFRTLNKPDNSVSICLVAGVVDGDLTCASTTTVRIKEQLDGNGRPLAAPVILLHNRLHRRPTAVEIRSRNHPPLQPSTPYSAEMRDLSRMTMTVHIGDKDVVFSNGQVDFEERSLYEQQNGSIHFSSNGRFARIALTMDTAKAFQDLANCIQTVRRMKALTNITVFVTKPLVHHMENNTIGSRNWEKSKHYDKSHYFPALVRALTALQKWKQERSGRDVQIISVANVVCTLVTYFHSPGRKHTPETGFRHFTLPLFIHQDDDTETFAVPCGTFKMDAKLCYTTYTYNKGVRKSDLRNGTPFQLIQPHFHLHGYPNPAYSQILQNVLYKVSVFTEDETDFAHLSDEERSAKVTHNHVTIKTILDDIDNMELLLGPVVGQVTSSTVNIVFEVNRRADTLLCVLQPVGNPTKLKKIQHRALPFQPVVYQFDELEPDQVYEILMPEIYGQTIIGKFRSLSSKAYFSEILFLGDEHLEHFPIASKVIDELMSQQVINFEQLRAISYVRKYEKDSREEAGVDATLDSDDPAYRRPWICLSERMKGLACTTSTVFHLGSHALLSRLLRHIIPPLVKTVKKYNIDLEKYEKSSAVSKFYQMQLNQIIEDSLRLVWIVEPVLKDVFCNSSNIPLYNSEYWLSESKVWGAELGINFTDRDVVALEKVRKLFTKNLENFIYPLKSWRKKAKNHFHVWKEGTVTVLTLDQTSEQAKHSNNQVVGAAKSALGRIEEQDEEEEVKKVVSKSSKQKKGKEAKVEDEMKAKTYDASFMSEHQWKQIRAILMEKDTKQLVICMQFPMIPLELADDEEEEVQSQTQSEFGNTLTWTPKEEDIAKFFGQMLKWMMPKKGKRAGKTLSFVCVANKSYMTNIQDMKSGMKIQQLCLGKFSCVKKSFGKEEDNTEMSSALKYKMNGKIGTWKFQHRLEGLDEVNINSDYCGNGGVYTGRPASNREPYSAVYGMMRFWFDSWKPTGVWNFNQIRAVGPPEEMTGDAVMLVGPIIGAPHTNYVEGQQAATTMIVPFLFELDRQVKVTCIATDLFNGTQVVITQEILKNRPTVFRLANLNIDTRYTVDFVEGVQNAYSSRFVVQTNCHWDDTNIMIFNMEQRGAQDPTTNDSSYIKSMSDRLRLPFHGINCVLHVNCFVDVNAIFDEVEFMPELKTLLGRVKVPSIDEITRSEVIHKLKKMVNKIMDRVRLEYRLYFSRPSYRELLIRGFHLFMGRESYKEAEATDTDPAGSLIALLRLIASRVNQEYFDQLIAPEEEVYSAWPRIEYTEEMRRQMKEKEEQRLQDLEDGEEPLIDPNNPDGIRLLTLDDYLDKNILNVPLKRRPFRTFFDNAENPVDCVLFQWMQNFVPPPVLWKSYVSPNQKVTIEHFCTCNDEHIRDIHERIVNSEIHRGARLIVMPNFGPLMNPQSLLGYKMSQWTRRWVKEGVDRTITLVAPSKEREGSHHYTIAYGAWPDPYTYARVKKEDIPPPLEGSLNIQTLHSIYMSNEKEMARIKKEKVEAIKEKTKTTSKSRGAMEKKKKEEAILKENLKVELQTIFQSLTPDGFVLFENRSCSTQASDGADMTIGYTEMKTVGTKLDKSMSADGQDTTPKPHDYLNLPLWITKFVPASAGVFVQDEVNIVIRQEPFSRKALDIIETDENIVKMSKKIYLSSRLSELSRPEDLREYDMEVDGIKEMFLEEIVARIWREALPSEVKGRLFTLTDDFIRAICVRRAFTDIDRDLSSPLNFCKAARRLLLANAQLFLAFKMSKMERWKYILETEEFPEDFDRPYHSDDEDSDVETKDDETEMTTKDDAETDSKMTESVAELPSQIEDSVVGGSLEILSEDGAGGGGGGGRGGDNSTVEGLFDRNLDNASVVPKDESNEAKDEVKDEVELERGGEGGGGENTQEEGGGGEEVQKEGGEKDKEGDQEEEEKQQEQEGEAEKEEEEVEVDLGGTPAEDLPLTDSEKIALQQVDTLFNLNWRRLEKKREVGEKLSYMSTNFLS